MNMATDPGYNLICAVRSGNVQNAKELIEIFGLSHSKAWSNGYNLLRDALQYKQQEVTKLLLTSGSKINSKSKRPSTTPLHFAVKNGYTEIVEMLLKRQANVNAKDHSGETPLHSAIDRGSLEIVKLLMNRKAGIHVKSNIGVTPLYLAVQKGNLAIVEELLSHGAQTDSHTHPLRKHLMPLHCAAAQGNVAMVELLLRKSAEVNVKSRDKRTPLHVAADMGQDKVVKLLLEKGANVNTCDKNGKTVLQVAVEKAHLTTVEEILQFHPDLEIGANRNSLYVAINVPQSDSMNAIIDALLRYGLTVRVEDAKDVKLLHTAVKKGYLNVVDALLKLGADVNALHTTKKTMTLLHTAALNSQPEIANLLVVNGAKVDTKDCLGKSAISYAIENRDVETMKFLLNSPSGVEITTDILHTAVKKECRNIVEILLQRASYIDVNDCDKLGRTALHHTVLSEGWDFSSAAFFSANPGPDDHDSSDARVEMAKMFLNRGANVNAKTKNNMTALHFAAESGYFKIVQILLDHKADVNSLGEFSTTPLHLAAKRENKAIVEILLDRGAEINARLESGKTPLHIASKNGHKDVVKLLAERGADLDTKDNDKSSALHLATENGYAEVVQTLLEIGVNVEIKNKYGRTPLHVAAKHGWPAVAKLLLDHDANINVTCKDSMTPLDYATLGSNDYNCRQDERLFRENFDYGLDDDDYNHFDYVPHDHECFSDPDYDDFYDYFADDYDSDSDCPCQEIEDMLEQHIITIKALGLYVSEKNLQALDLLFEHRPLFERCQIQINNMKSKKIGDSSVSFHDIVTKEIYQLAVYARNQSIVQALEADNYGSEFPSYCEMIERRFKQGQKRERLLCAGLKSLTVLSGYALPDLSAIKLLNYLSNKDLKNLIGAEPKSESES